MGEGWRGIFGAAHADAKGRGWATCGGGRKLEKRRDGVLTPLIFFDKSAGAKPVCDTFETGLRTQALQGRYAFYRYAALKCVTDSNGTVVLTGILAVKFVGAVHVAVRGAKTVNTQRDTGAQFAYQWIFVHAVTVLPQVAV